MVQSPTDDLFNTQQWEHWAMIFILVLGLVVGYGQAAAEDKLRVQRRRGVAGRRGPGRTRTRQLLRKRPEESRRRPSPQQMQAIAPKRQRNPLGQGVASLQSPPPRPDPNTRLPGQRQTVAPRRKADSPLNRPLNRPRQ